MSRTVGTDPEVRLVLIASPLLGPAVWGPVARLLAAQGWTSMVAPSPGAVGDPGDVVDRWLQALPEDAPLILVPHSNAGLYVAALAEQRDVRGVVFADAGLPSRGPSTRTAPDAFRQLLAGLVEEDGRLPIWTRWWSEDDLEGLFPDRQTRALVEAEQVRLPLAYFEALLPSPSRWQELPAAYLAFGDTYEAERTAAQTRGWPTRTLAGSHLHQLVDPVGVGAALEELLGQLGFRPRR